MTEPKCPTCGRFVNKQNVGRHIFGDCEGLFDMGDGPIKVMPNDRDTNN